MCKARLTEHQIIAVLKSVETGRTVKDACREAGISVIVMIMLLFMACYEYIFRVIVQKLAKN
ncbi:hypothetical protein F9U42_16085 [Pectobacterium versatile]|nr:hypothetical protein [Pectobacterium versatile]